MRKAPILWFVAGLLVASLFELGARALAQRDAPGNALLRLWEADGTVRDFDCVALPPEPTPTPEDGPTETPPPTALPTNTPRPSATPSPTPTPVPACYGLVTADVLNIRSSPGGTVVGKFYEGDRIGLVGRSGAWYEVTISPPRWVSAEWVTVPPDALCSFAPQSKLGLHLTVGASQDVVMRALPRLGLLKGTDNTEDILRAARSQRPDLLILWRNLSTAYGTVDCPPSWGRGDARPAADLWWSAHYTTWEQRGLLGVVNYYELTNECGWAGQYEVDFWLRILDDARLARVCVCVGSWTYGTPEPAEFRDLVPVLDYMLAHPCAPGRYHALCAHTYEGHAGGYWLFGRWKLLLDAVPNRFAALPWVFSEYGYNKGSGPVDCAALWADWALASAEYKKDRAVLGAALFNHGAGGWLEVSPCL